MPFQQWSLPRRRDYIRELRHGGPILEKYPVEFQGRLQYLDVHTVDIEFPCYRLANGRTQAEQKEYIALNGLSDDFFSADPDSAPALEAQHGILRDMAREAKLFEILKKSRQDQPLILEKEGYIINGNRRLCVMRMLLEEDETQYSHFRRVQVVLLPPCSQRDIDELEARLQIRPEGRADYSWVDRAMMFKAKREHNWTDDQLGDLYDRRPSEIRKEIAMLEDADAYLEEREQKGHYSNVVDKEFAFRQLQKGRARCATDEAKKQLFTAISYAMLDDPSAAGDRLYESIPEALKYIENIAAQVRSDFSAELATVPQPTGQNTGLEILGETPSSEYTTLAQFLRDTRHGDRIRATIKDTLEEMSNLENQRRDANFCLKQLQQALTKLHNVSIAFDDRTNMAGIEQALENLGSALMAIRVRISDVNAPH